MGGEASAKGRSSVLLRGQDGSAMRVAPMTSRFLDACRRRPTDVRPVWFMRQAGRYMKQYRDVRARHGMLAICKRTDLAATLTLQLIEVLDVVAAIIFAGLQVTAGARAIQVFDSWVGALGPDDYVRFVAPYSRALIERVRSTGVPVIHFGTGASGYFRELHAAGGDVMGCDWRINIDQAWMDISYRSAIQGNLDPVLLFAPIPELRTRIHELLKRTGSRPGHIFNLGHGILPETPVDHVKAAVQIVREFKL